MIKLNSFSHLMDSTVDFFFGFDNEVPTDIVFINYDDMSHVNYSLTPVSIKVLRCNYKKLNVTFYAIVIICNVNLYM